MPSITIHLNNHEKHGTVSEMRRALAQVLSKLEGEQEVVFTFTATTVDRREPAKSKTLGAPCQTTPMQIAQEESVPDGSGDSTDPCLEVGDCRLLSERWPTRWFGSDWVATPHVERAIVYGKLARPEND